MWKKSRTVKPWRKERPRESERGPSRREPSFLIEEVRLTRKLGKTRNDERFVHRSDKTTLEKLGYCERVTCHWRHLLRERIDESLSLVHEPRCDVVTLLAPFKIFIPATKRSSHFHCYFRLKRVTILLTL